MFFSFLRKSSPPRPVLKAVWRRRLLTTVAVPQAVLLPAPPRPSPSREPAAPAVWVAPAAPAAPVVSVGQEYRVGPAVVLPPGTHCLKRVLEMAADLVVAGWAAAVPATETAIGSAMAALAGRPAVECHIWPPGSPRL